MPSHLLSKRMWARQKAFLGERGRRPLWYLSEGNAKIRMGKKWKYLGSVPLLLYVSSQGCRLGALSPFLGLIQCLDLPGFPPGVQTASHSPKYAAFLPILMPLCLVLSRLRMSLPLPPTPPPAPFMPQTHSPFKKTSVSLHASLFLGTQATMLTLLLWFLRTFVQLFACFKDCCGC